MAPPPPPLSKPTHTHTHAARARLGNGGPLGISLLRLSMPPSYGEPPLPPDHRGKRRALPLENQAGPFLLHKLLGPRPPPCYPPLPHPPPRGGAAAGRGHASQAASRALGIRSPWMEKTFPGLDVTHTMIAAMLTAKEWVEIADPAARLDRFDRKGTAEQEKAKLSANVADYAQGILDVLETCPRDLLLLLKTNDALRSAAGRLGGCSADTFVVTAKSCIRALWLQRSGAGLWWRRVLHRLHLAVAYGRCHTFQLLQDATDRLAATSR